MVEFIPIDYVLLVVAGWLVTAVVTLACGAYLWQTLAPSGH